MSGIFKKINNEDRWNNLYIYNEDIKYGKYTFLIRILECSKELSLIFGFFDATYKNPN